MRTSAVRRARPWPERPGNFKRLEAERIGGPIRLIRARPWLERPVSAANKSGSDTAAPRRALSYLRSLLATSGVVNWLKFGRRETAP